MSLFHTRDVWPPPDSAEKALQWKWRWIDSMCALPEHVSESRATVCTATGAFFTESGVANIAEVWKKDIRRRSGNISWH